MTMKITYDMLIKANACKEQVSLFKATFPKGSTVTARAVAKALKVGLGVQFIARFLPPAAQAEYDKVRSVPYAEYYKVRNAAQAEYDKVRNAAQAEYDKVRSAAQAEYDKVRSAALVNAFKSIK